jgi:hypothetical protein
MKLHKMLVIVLGCGLSLSAFAQWQWIDNTGSKVFSDRAPPPDIPAKNILKQPGGTLKIKTVVETSTAASAPSAPKISGVDKALEEKKKQADEAEAAKRKADSDKTASARAENCVRARESKASYDSGIRIARVNEKGEREIMDDAARNAESQRIQGIISSECK